MIGWFLDLPTGPMIVVALLLILIVILVAIHMDVYLIGWGQVKIPKEGLTWVDADGNRRVVPENPTGRDLTICFGHVLFKVFPFALKTYFGWNDRVCTAPGHIPKNAATLFHEVFHASIQSIRKGILFLPWYILNMPKAEAEADAHARKMKDDPWGREALDYIHHERRGRTAG